MKKKIALIQMQAVLADVETNYRHAEELMEQAMEGNPDILVLPETWNTGFYISRKLKSIADEGGKRTETFLSSFAKKHHVNVVGGSAAVLCGDDVYNRSFVFDREGRKIAEYDKVHGFSYAHEPMYFKGGDHAVSFTLDDISCSMVICYDIRFPELVRRPGRESGFVFYPCRLAESTSFPLDAFRAGKSGGESDLSVRRQPRRNFRENGVRGKLGASRSLGE